MTFNICGTIINIKDIEYIVKRGDWSSYYKPAIYLKSGARVIVTNLHGDYTSLLTAYDFYKGE